MQNNSRKLCNFGDMPDEVLKHIFSFLDGRTLIKMCNVCRRWDRCVSDNALWKTLCLRKWRALHTDEGLLKFVDDRIGAPERDRISRVWKFFYFQISLMTRYSLRLETTYGPSFRVLAHHLHDDHCHSGVLSLPSALTVNRCFSLAHVGRIIFPESSVLYLEPETEDYRDSFEGLIRYLLEESRMGLSVAGPPELDLGGSLIFIFVPPCDYTRVHWQYQGRSLLCFPQ